MQPRLSYFIWHTPRTGSTLLCKALESTGIAGKPGEYLTLPENASLTSHYGVESYDELKQKIWRLGSSQNGVFGVKYSRLEKIHNQLLTEIKILRGLNGQIEEQKIWADLFPHCRHIFLYRRNKIRQSVSWWKAIQDEQWHIESGQDHRYGAEFYRGKYDFDALRHLLKECSLREAATQEYFNRSGIVPLTIVYEDFIKNYEKTIREIATYLRLNVTEVKVNPPYYRKAANDLSEIWVQSFRKDLQEGWENPAW